MAARVPSRFCEPTGLFENVGLHSETNANGSYL